MQKGLIIRSTGLWYEVANADGHIYTGRLRGKNKLAAHKVTNPIAVGDYVHFEIEDTEENRVIIHEILPRQNYISRQSPHKTNHGHIIAANIDQAFILATLAMPRTSLGFIDRCLVTAEAFRIPTFVVFNKTDILSEEGQAYQTELCQLYAKIGYQSLQISALADENFNLLLDLISQKKTLIIGHSGVGKSTLLNRLAPNLTQKTSGISNYSQKGVHTTTFAEMFEILPQTYVIDTPGIKELGLDDMPTEDIAHYFPEMRQLLGQCRYHDCTHINEPACAVKQAVEQGQISLTRYHSYLSMASGQDNRR
jgi:ribosome biogenesis GTPase / thiamine phosphate phosphatase